ncbi:MAG: hypothetical protein ABMB14_06870 [Myxococcota bacterium]
MKASGFRLDDLGFDSMLARVRTTLAGAHPIDGLDGLVHAVERRLREVVTETSDTDATGDLSVAVHIGVGAVAVEILTAHAREWIQLT